jgi:hypothetical protein
MSSRSFTKPAMLANFIRRDSDGGFGPESVSRLNPAFYSVTASGQSLRPAAARSSASTVSPVGLRFLLIAMHKRPGDTDKTWAICSRQNGSTKVGVFRRDCCLLWFQPAIVSTSSFHIKGLCQFALRIGDGLTRHYFLLYR